MSKLDPGCRTTESPASGQEPSAGPAPRPISGRRREKQQLSCNNCRRRKSRCDRQQPCSICAARGLMCTYPEALPMLQPRPPATAMPSMHDRLIQLERLVLSLKSSTPTITTEAHPPMEDDPLSQTSSVAVTTPTDAPSESGSMLITSSESRYVGGDHWAAIMEGIADMKDHLEWDEHPQLVNDSDGHNHEPYSSYSHALLLYGTGKPASRAELLAVLPPRNAVDRYVSRYFNSIDSISVSVHGPTFLREYELFWQSPFTVNIAWLGLLFSMICLAVSTSDAAELLTTSYRRSVQTDLYREKIVQCLFAAEYTSPGPYVLETLSHYVYIEFVLHADANRDVWLLLSLMVNLAKRMGYHRDPSHFRGISPLQSELRRRLWSKVLMSDLLFSSQVGMPRMVCEGQYDSTEPRNLSDADLDGLGDHGELLASRPETEFTPMLNHIVRRRMLIALGTVLDLTTAVKPPSYVEVMRVDAVLRAAAEQIPVPLKPKGLAASVTDPPAQIFARLFLQHLLYKGQIMLHRRFLPAHEYSRNSVIEACLRTLEMQHLFDEETQPGGVLYSMRWRVTSSMNHLFLTATVILCSLVKSGQLMGQEGDVVVALRRSRDIWVRRSRFSKEAKQVFGTVSSVLADGGRGNMEEQPNTVEPSFLEAFDQGNHEFGLEMADINMGGELDDWMTLNSIVTGWQEI